MGAYYLEILLFGLTSKWPELADFAIVVDWLRRCQSHREKKGLPCSDLDPESLRLSRILTSDPSAVVGDYIGKGATNEG